MQDEPLIDITFNVLSDTPVGKDPDSYSPTLRRYHSILWSKKLPSGSYFSLDLSTPRVLRHRSSLGEFFLSSDQIGNTYRHAIRMQGVIRQVPIDDLESFANLRATIAGHTIFPARRVENKMTINGARGVNHKIQDRFDLTLECIRRYYKGEHSPLSDVLQRYADFFELFEDFKGYVDFFLFQDLVAADCSEIQFWRPFDDFSGNPLPSSLPEYLSYKGRVISFLNARNSRIQRYASSLTNSK